MLRVGIAERNRRKRTARKRVWFWSEPSAVTSYLPADEVVWVRVLLLDDHQGLRVMFSRVSSETIYRRFHTPYPRVPEWTPVFLMDADERGGRSLVAVVREEIVGHAMCSRPEVGEAEVAIVVGDR